MRCLSFFYYFAKELKGISGRMVSCARAQSGALTVWSTGSFRQGSDKVSYVNGNGNMLNNQYSLMKLDR